MIKIWINNFKNLLLSPIATKTIARTGRKCGFAKRSQSDTTKAATPSTFIIVK